jgi:MFS family permease
LIWLGFVSFGIYTVTILNTLRAYISQNATNKGSVYGIFYAGNAVSAAIGVIVAGYIWTYSNSLTALWISFIGTLLVGLGNMIYTRKG